jgi:hypothetical protein
MLHFAFATSLLPFLTAGGDGGAVATHDLVLTAAEKKAALELAGVAIKDAGLAKGKMVLTGCEVFRDRRGGKVQRMLLLIHYRYDGDLAILTSIDLAKRAVLDVEAVPHMPTSLAPEELAAADKLARANPIVSSALAREKGPIEVDALVHYTTNEKSPSYRHRVVRLFFRQGRTYLLYGPVVEVDLSTATVRVEAPTDGHK